MSNGGLTPALHRGSLQRELDHAIDATHIKDADWRAPLKTPDWQHLPQKNWWDLKGFDKLMHSPGAFISLVFDIEYSSLSLTFSIFRARLLHLTHELGPVKE